jgi:alpha-mannosidase
MYYALERVSKITQEIKAYVYSDSAEISSFDMKEGNYRTIQEANDSPLAWQRYEKETLWGGHDQHCWFRTKVKVPKHFSGKTIALNISTGEGGWDAINPQFILYVDGELIQGLDVNHREVIIAESAEANREYTIDLHAYSGMQSKKSFLFGELVVVEKELRRLYFNIQVPVWVIEKLPKDDKKSIDMLTVLNDTINILDLRKPYSKLFYESVDKANKYVEEELYEKMGGHEDVIATCVGHTHIDVAWQWTVAQTREKVARSFSTVLNLMKQYPEYIFMSSQPQLYKFLKEDYPDVYSKVKQKVKDGVWEPEGAMWLEADCNVTSGESLVRQIMFGTRFFEQEFGVKNEVLWLPDVFGYSAALPQILQKSDIPYFMTTKIAWNQFNKMPYDTFMWKGIDGTEVLTHFITTKDPYQDPNTHFTTYNGQIHPGAIMGGWDRYQQKDINNDILISFGFGDGGGGATYEMLETGRRMSKGIPGCPKVKMGKAADYFERLDRKVSGNKRLPKWVGELYLEYHRGTYTSMARNKRANRKSELIFHDAETLSSLAMLLGKEYPKEKINKSWENILLNQFHDILPGSSIKEVYDVTKEEYKKILNSGKEIVEDAMNTIAHNIDLKQKSVVVYNTLSFDRDDIVKFDLPEGIKNPVVVDQDGTKELCQIIEEKDKKKAIFFARKVPAKGYRAYKIIDEKENIVSEIQIADNRLENKYFVIDIDKNGAISNLYDKTNKREVLKHGEKGNNLQAFEDKPMNYDNWDIDIYYQEKMWEVNDVEKIEVIERGPVRGGIRITKRFMDSTIIQNMYIYRDIPRVDFDTFVDWKESQTLLKTSFPVDVHADYATYEIQFGNVERPTHWNTSWDVARFEVCAQKWADLSEDGYGVSIINDCKYGHDIKDGRMRLTLIKSGIEPNKETDKEKHYFAYSIYPHEGGWRDAKTVQEAYKFNVSL